MNLGASDAPGVDRWLRAAAVVWVVLWMVLGGLVGWNIYRLRQLSETMESAGSALDEVAEGLDAVAAVPVIGGQVGEVGDEVANTAADTRRSADASRRTITQLSVLLGGIVVLATCAPVVGLYVPYRRQRAREIAAIRSALANDEDDAVEGFLAQRAVARIPFHELRKFTADPWGDLRSGRVAALADAELTRLGIARTSAPPSVDAGAERADATR